MYAGHDVEHLLDTYSLEQLGSHASWVMRYQVEMLNMLLGPVAGMTGADWKPHRVNQQAANRPRDPKHHRNADFTDPAKKEAALEVAMARRFRVRTKVTSKDGGGDSGGAPS